MTEHRDSATRTLNLTEVSALQAPAAHAIDAALAARHAHAFAIYAPRGMGATALARQIALRTLCPNGGTDNCDVCGRILRGTHPDALMVQAEGTDLSVEDIDRLVAELVRTPFEAAAQVAIIDDAETLGDLNAEAANRLLKVIEEPPGDVVFVLLVRQPGTLLPTLRSRVLEIPLRACSREALAEFVTGRYGAQLARYSAAQIAQLASGNPGRASDFAAGGDAVERYALISAALADVCSGLVEPADVVARLLARVDAVAARATDVAEAFFAAQRERLPESDAKRLASTSDSRGHTARVRRRVRRVRLEEANALCAEIALWYRDLIAVSTGASELVVGVDRVDSLVRLADSAAAKTAILAIDIVGELPVHFRVNVDQLVAWNAAFAELAGLAAGRIRSRRAYGPTATTAQGLGLML